MQAFRLDRASGIPVKEQVKAQVWYQIAAGLLYPGDQLPSLRDLAAGLAVNLNTVVRAVEELTQEGYLYSRQGKGVFVADDPPCEPPGAALRSLLAGALASAGEWGMSPAELAMALIAQAQLARSPQSARARLLLVGTDRADLRSLQRQLESLLPEVAVVPALPEELGRAAPSFPVAATLFHGGALRRHRAVLLAGPREQAALRRLRELEPGSPVVVVAADWVQAARIRQSLESSGLTHLRFAAARDPAGLAPLMADAAFLVAAPSGRRLAEEALAIRPDLPCLIEPLSATPEAIAALRASLGAPAPAHRVALRSSWV